MRLIKKLIYVSILWLLYATTTFSHKKNLTVQNSVNLVDFSKTGNAGHWWPKLLATHFQQPWRTKNAAGNPFKKKLMLPLYLQNLIALGLKLMLRQSNDIFSSTLFLWTRLPVIEKKTKRNLKRDIMSIGTDRWVFVN